MPSSDGITSTESTVKRLQLVVFLLDGLEIGRNTDRTPHVPMHWVLQTETALDLTAPPSRSVRGDVDVDWVTAYAYDPAVKAPLPQRYVRIVAPPVVNGTTALGLTASAGIEEAKWVVNGVEVGWDPTPPFTTAWDTNDLPNGIYSIYAKSRDGGGWIDSPVPVTVTVESDGAGSAAAAEMGGLLRSMLIAAAPSASTRGVRWALMPAVLAGCAPGRRAAVARAPARISRRW